MDRISEAEEGAKLEEVLKSILGEHSELEGEVLSILAVIGAKEAVRSLARKEPLKSGGYLKRVGRFCEQIYELNFFKMDAILKISLQRGTLEPEFQRLTALRKLIKKIDEYYLLIPSVRKYAKGIKLKDQQHKFDLLVIDKIHGKTSCYEIDDINQQLKLQDVSREERTQLVAKRAEIISMHIDYAARLDAAAMFLSERLINQTHEPTDHAKNRVVYLSALRETVIGNPDKEDNGVTTRKGGLVLLLKNLLRVREYGEKICRGYEPVLECLASDQPVIYTDRSLNNSIIMPDKRLAMIDFHSFRNSPICLGMESIFQLSDLIREDEQPGYREQYLTNLVAEARRLETVLNQKVRLNLDHLVAFDRQDRMVYAGAIERSLKFFTLCMRRAEDTDEPRYLYHAKNCLGNACTNISRLIGLTQGAAAKDQLRSLYQEIETLKAYCTQYKI